MVASNMYFGYQMLTNCLKFGIAKGISEGGGVTVFQTMTSFQRYGILHLKNALFSSTTKILKEMIIK